MRLQANHWRKRQWTGSINFQMEPVERNQWQEAWTHLLHDLIRQGDSSAGTGKALLLKKKSVWNVLKVFGYWHINPDLRSPSYCAAHLPTAILHCRSWNRLYHSKSWESQLPGLFSGVSLHIREQTIEFCFKPSPLQRPLSTVKRRNVPCPTLGNCSDVTGKQNVRSSE